MKDYLKTKKNLVIHNGFKINEYIKNPIIIKNNCSDKRIISK